jgi:hypothetical protein
MLTLNYYYQLDEAEKADVIMQGNFLADREENGLIVQLYSVGHIYGELFYDPHANKILRFRAFDGTAQLTPYLARIRFNA